jgi:hypothetical protein
MAYLPLKILAKKLMNVIRSDDIDKTKALIYLVLMNHERRLDNNHQKE